MADPTLNPAPMPQQNNGNAGLPSTPDWGNFAQLNRSGALIPRLQATSAQTVSRDRWERLVTTIDIPATPSRIWAALTQPEELKTWLARCHGGLDQKGQDCMLDFEDGEFFLCRATTVNPPSQLQYLWRWMGIGQATVVTWNLAPAGETTRVTVIEEAANPPWDWQTWNGGGWPGILDQLANYLRTGTNWRWPWRRMGPYIQLELPVPVYPAWDKLTNPYSLKYWLLATEGSLTPQQTLPILMGDASGSVTMTIDKVIHPGQLPPSFLPYLTFSLNRPVWDTAVGGRLWLEPAGWGRCLLQVVHYGWENLPAELQLPERKILTRFWADAALRASQLFEFPERPSAPHNW